MQMTIVDNVDGLQKSLADLAGSGKRIAFVPTMGALHAGHIELVQAAKKIAEYVVVSIFVNPAQFGPNEDFDKYPRALESDLAMLREAGAALVYTPTLADMYPQGFDSSVQVGRLADILCGKFRPGHFNGVATVVTKLLLRVLPHVALFGEKDYQQLCVIKQLVYDLDIPIEIVGVPTIRQSDGLAMSSRNAYLTPQERQIAPKLHEILLAAREQILKGDAIESALMVGSMKLNSMGFKVEYLEYCQAESLLFLDELYKPSRLLVAARLGNTRLIDNVGIS